MLLSMGSQRSDTTENDSKVLASLSLSLSLPPSLSHYTQHSSGKYCHSLQKGLISYPYKEINRLEDN